MNKIQREYDLVINKIQREEKMYMYSEKEKICICTQRENELLIHDAYMYTERDIPINL